MLTLFPHAFEGFKTFGVLKRALQRGTVKLNLINIRDFCEDKHKQVDDTPYGTGDGMLIKVKPIFNALGSLGLDKPSMAHPRDYWRILMSPAGTRLTDKLAQELAKFRRLVVICGHYEGIDDRIRSFIDEEISIGDYVLSSGELSAMVLIDSVTRHVKGALSSESLRFESFKNSLLDFPQWTRPPEFMGMEVPQVLKSGDHREIRRFNLQKAIAYTLWKRPDLFKRLNLKLLQESYSLTLKELEDTLAEAIWEGLTCRT